MGVRDVARRNGLIGRGVCGGGGVRNVGISGGPVAIKGRLGRGCRLISGGIGFENIGLLGALVRNRQCERGAGIRYL